MTTQRLPFLIRAYILTGRVLQSVSNLAAACFAGCWLGLCRPDTFHLADELFYNHSDSYNDDAYNRRGLWPWEKQAISTHFRDRPAVLLLGAGGGREALALHKAGYAVTGFECNPQLLASARRRLAQEGFVPHLEIIARDQCPDSSGQFDGIIIGYNTYALIQGSGRRIALLRKLRTLARPGAPLLLSFLHHSGRGRRLRLIAALGTILRFILRREPVELGDVCYPNSFYTKNGIRDGLAVAPFFSAGKETFAMLPYFVHYFTQAELSAELQAGGFTPVSFSTDGHPHAIARAADTDRGEAAVR